MSKLSYLALSIFVSLPAFAGESAEDNDTALCFDISTIPALQELNRESKVLSNKEQSLKEKVKTLNDDCLSIRQNGVTQDGAVMQRIRTNTPQVTQESAAFREAIENFFDKLEPVRVSVTQLAHASCINNLKQRKDQLIESRMNITRSVSESCKLGLSKTDQAKLDANRVGGRGATSGDLSSDQVQAALLNKKDPNNAKLMAAAQAYQAQNSGLPNPAVNERDKTCGNSCMAILNLQRVEQAYGKNSFEYEEAMAFAKNTRPSRYGSIK